MSRKIVSLFGIREVNGGRENEEMMRKGFFMGVFFFLSFFLGPQTHDSNTHLVGVEGRKHEMVGGCLGGSDFRDSLGERRSGAATVIHCSL